MLTQSTRPKWQADTYVIPLSDGVYLRGNCRHLILKGKSLSPLLERLVPHLTGSITLAEITAGLDAERAGMVTRLLEKLFAHQFLRDASQAQCYTLSPDEREKYAPDLAFLESLQTSALAHFERFQSKRLLLIGSPSACAALVQASLRRGVREVGVLLSGESEEDAQSCSRRGEDAPLAHAHLLHVPSWKNEDEVREILRDYDAVLHVAGQLTFARTHLFNKLCLASQQVCMQAVIVDGTAWMGPLVCPETDACWECAWRRLSTNSPALANQSAIPLARDTSLTASAATLIANRLLFVLFQYFTGAASPETFSQVSALDLTTFLSEQHTFLPHPACLACQHPVPRTAPEFLDQVRHLQQEKPLDPAALLENFAACVDERSGLFTAFENDQFVQVPLAVYEVRGNVPGEQQSAPLSVVAAGIDTREASLRAAHKACELYAAACMERRYLLAPTSEDLRAYPVISPAHLIGYTRLPAADERCREDEMWTWAQDLHTRQAVLVPATRVFSRPGTQERGLGSGQTWEEAVCQALLDWCNFFTIEHLRDAQQVYPRVDLARAGLTSQGMHFTRLLDAAGVQLTVYDVTGSLGVPTFAICAGEQVVAYSTRCASAEALDLGLARAVQHYQAAQFQQPNCAPVPVPAFPVHLRGDAMSVPRDTAPADWPARQEWLLRQLQSHHLHASVVPLDHDPALARVSPFVVRVLVEDEELAKGK